MGLAETHLVGTDIIEIEGYKWYGQNRKNAHKCQEGFRGIRFLIKGSIIQECNVDLLDSSSEEILWLFLQHKVSGDNLTVCVCYLPPLNSCRHVDAHSFFDCLMTSIIEYQNKRKMYVCGDLNSR